ncbi:MAG: histidine phosphatase family protein [Suipraeoptans sp.]
MKVYFVRHGETNWNKQHKIQGRTDNPLNESGIIEAKELAAALAHYHFDKAYTSPLIRARETAKIALERHTPHLEVKVDDLLIEIAYGVNEGADISNIKNEPKKSLHKYFYNPQEYVPDEGGETIEALCRRCKSFLNMLEETTSVGETVIVFCHGALIRGIISTVQNLNVSDFWKGKTQGNCTATILSCKNGVWNVLDVGIDMRT